MVLHYKATWLLLVVLFIHNKEKHSRLFGCTIVLFSFLTEEKL